MVKEEGVNDLDALKGGGTPENTPCFQTFSMAKI